MPRKHNKSKVKSTRSPTNMAWTRSMRLAYPLIPVNWNQTNKALTSRFVGNKEVASVTPKFVIPELSPEPLVLNSDKAPASLPIEDLIPLALERARGRTVQELAQERSVTTEVIDYSLSKVFLDYNPICFKNEKGFLSTNALSSKHEISLSVAFEALKDKGLIDTFPRFNNTEKGWRINAKQTRFLTNSAYKKGGRFFKHESGYYLVWPECMHPELADLIQEFNQSRKVISKKNKKKEQVNGSDDEAYTKVEFSKVNQGLGLPSANDLVFKIAESFGESWPVARSHEKIGIYAGKSFEQLRGIRGIGAKKARALLKYLVFAQSKGIIEPEETVIPAVSLANKPTSAPLSYVSIPDWSYKNYLKWVDPHEQRKPDIVEPPPSEGWKYQDNSSDLVKRSGSLHSIAKSIDKGWKRFWIKRGVRPKDLNKYDPNWSLEHYTKNAKAMHEIYKFIKRKKRPLKAKKIMEDLIYVEEGNRLDLRNVVRLLKAHRGILLNHSTREYFLKEWTRPESKVAVNFATSEKKPSPKKIRRLKNKLLKEHDRVASRLGITFVSEIELLKYGRYSRNNYLDAFDKMNDFLKYARGESDDSGNAPSFETLNQPVKLSFGSDGKMTENITGTKANE
jgi:hypothetical protein